MTTPPSNSPSSARAGVSRSSDVPLLVRALRCQKVERVPVWLMRQAGRYMEEYREVRRKTDFLRLCKSPAPCAEVMATAVDRLGVDAAIIFSDLLPILEPLGFELTYAPGDGPIIGNPLREPSDLTRVRELTDLAPMEYQFDVVRQTRRVIPKEKAVIGFAGAPFTLAGYAIEGRSSRTFERTRALMRSEPSLWHDFLGLIARSVARVVNAQMAASADALQLFDSWAGVLTPEEYRTYVLPHLRSLLERLTPGIPVIYFWTGNPALLPLIAPLKVACVGVDHRVRLDDAINILPPTTALQGNMAPVVLLSDIPTIRAEVKKILDTAAGRPGYIFNLGHGVLKQTPVENAIELVRFVQNYRR